MNKGIVCYYRQGFSGIVSVWTNVVKEHDQLHYGGRMENKNWSYIQNKIVMVLRYYPNKLTILSIKSVPVFKLYFKYFIK